MKEKKITTALVSVLHKDMLDEILRHMAGLNISILSTGGTKEFNRKSRI